jgi:hypothetical protein
MLSTVTCAPAPRTEDKRRMEYRGKQYSVVQGLDTMWKWSVPALVGQTKSGKAENHAAGVKAAQQAIDKALAPKSSAYAARNEGGRRPTLWRLSQAS